MRIESALVFDVEKRTFGILPDYDALIPYWLTTDNPNQNIPIAAGGQTNAFPMSYRPDGPFRGHYLIYTCENAAAATHDHLLVRMTDGRDGYQYMSGSQRVHILTIASNDPGYPAILSESLLLQHGANVTVDFQNLDTVNAVSVLRFGIQGFAFQPGRIQTQELRDKLAAMLERQRYIRPYFLTPDAGSLTVANNAAGQAFITLDDMGYFEVFKVAAVVYQAGTLNWLTAAQARRVLLRIKDNVRTDFSPGLVYDMPLSWFLTGALRPNVLPVRYMVAPKTQLVLDVRNDSGVGITLYITLLGRRIFTPAV